MAAQDRTFQTADRPRPNVTKDRAFTFTFRAYSDGTQSIPSSATITIRGPGGVALATPVTDASVTVAGGGDMTYALTSGNAGVLGANYSADVAYVVSGTTHSARFLFDVVRCPFVNPVLTADLVLHHPDLTDYIMTGETAQAHIEQAYEDVCTYIQSKGKREYLVLDSSDLRRPIEHLALGKLFFAKIKQEGDKMDRLSAFHMKAFESSLQSVNLIYDEDDSGTADGTSSLDAESGEEGGAHMQTSWRI